jgi:hypothetical protein
LHRPGDEKRMPVIVAANDQAAWLSASPDEARGFLRTTDAALMTGGPAPLPQRAARAGGLKAGEAGPPGRAVKASRAAKSAVAGYNNYSLF